jgi:hypothetical protein
MIVNRTPHLVTLYDQEDNVRQQFPPEDPAVRLEVLEMGQTGIDGLMVPLVGYGTMTDAPLQQREMYYIVSLPVALAVRRADFLVPFDEVRDGKGQIIGCRALAKVV